MTRKKGKKAIELLFVQVYILKFSCLCGKESLRYPLNPKLTVLMMGDASDATQVRDKYLYYTFTCIRKIHVKVRYALFPRILETLPNVGHLTYVYEIFSGFQGNTSLFRQRGENSVNCGNFGISHKINKTQIYSNFLLFSITYVN